MSIHNKLAEHMRSEPWGALLVRYGFEPYDTESSARRVAEKAAEDIAKLRAALERLLAFTNGFTQHCASKPSAKTQAMQTLKEIQ